MKEGNAGKRQQAIKFPAREKAPIQTLTKTR